MTHIDRAAETIALHHGGGDYAAKHTATMLAIEGLLAADPQIIRTPAELKALDPDTILQPPLTAFSEWPQILTAAGLLGAIRTWEGPWLPTVKVAEGAHLSACRDALEGCNSWPVRPRNPPRSRR